jgi:hypothetical protein
MEAAGSTETLVMTYQTTWHHIPEVTNVKTSNLASLVYDIFAKAAVLRFASWKKSLCMHTNEMGENMWILAIGHRVSETRNFCFQTFCCQMYGKQTYG